MNDLYLVHHGIKGQKWGDRNGPPYPLDADDHSVREKSKGTKGWSKDARKENDKKDHKLTDKQKKILIGGAVAAGVILAGYGAYKLGPKAVTALTGNDMKIDPSTGFRLLNSKGTYMEELNKINPGRVRVFSKTKNWEIIDGSSCNCMLCTTAYDLRMRGYDVRAGFAKTGFTTDDLFPKIYKNYKETVKINPIKGSVGLFGDITDGEKTYKELVQNLSQYETGARGNICVWWPIGGGHSMIWEKTSSGVRFLDGQTGQEYKNFAKEILSKTRADEAIEILRTDNLEIDPIAIKNYINADTAAMTYVKKGANIAKNVTVDVGIPTAILGGYIYSNYGDEIKNRINERKKTNEKSSDK